MAESKNNFDATVSSLFKGMDSFLSAKTVVGDAVHVNDTIILPLCDVNLVLVQVHLRMIKRIMPVVVWVQRCRQAQCL